MSSSPAPPITFCQPTTCRQLTWCPLHQFARSAESFGRITCNAEVSDKLRFAQVPLSNDKNRHPHSDIVESYRSRPKAIALKIYATALTPFDGTLETDAFFFCQIVNAGAFKFTAKVNRAENPQSLLFAAAECRLIRHGASASFPPTPSIHAIACRWSGGPGRARRTEKTVLYPIQGSSRCEPWLLRSWADSWATSTECSASPCECNTNDEMGLAEENIKATTRNTLSILEGATASLTFMYIWRPEYDMG